MTMPLHNVVFSDDSFDFDPTLSAPRAQGSVSGQARAADAIVPPGYYSVKIIAAGLKTDRDTGELIRDKNDRPVFAIQRVAVVGPEAYADASIPLFQDLYTNGFQPKNFKTGETLPGPKVFPFIQALASIDETLPVTDYNTNIHELSAQLANKPVITVRLGYTATDVEYAKAQIRAGVDRKQAYKEAEIKPGAFRNADGTWNTEVLGPSGLMVKAKMRITEWVRSSDLSKTLGPLQAKAVA